MGILDHLSNIRFTRACDWYVQVGSRATGTGARSGAHAIPAVAARAQAHADGLAATDPNAPATPPPSPGLAASALAALGRGMQTVIGWEQSLTSYLSVIPFPGIPALQVFAIAVGLPHAHNHPPNLTPPNPVPIPLPSIGPVIPIPILSGAERTMVGGSPAARCGDMGLGVWCGGYFPMYEIFLGSATVWIESARASRIGIDITKHCIFSAPKPSDPPMGPMIGATVSGAAGNVQVGGIPMPSLFSLAVAGLFKALSRGFGAVFRRLTARSYVNRLIRNGTLSLNHVHAPHVPASWSDDVMRDLQRIAGTRSGREMLGDLARTGRHVEIRPLSVPQYNAFAIPGSADGLMDIPTGLRMPGADSAIEHTPSYWANHTPTPGGGPHPNPGSTSDALLFHELNHTNNIAHGAATAEGTSTVAGWDQRWKNFEEYSTVAAENGYRSETGLPLRDHYGPIP